MQREVLYGYRANHPVTMQSLARSYLMHEGHHDLLLDTLKKEHPLTEQNRAFWKEFHGQLRGLKPLLFGDDAEQTRELQKKLKQKIKLIKDLIP